MQDRKALEGELGGGLIVVFDSVASDYSPVLHRDFIHVHNKGNRIIIEVLVPTVFHRP